MSSVELVLITRRHGGALVNQEVVREFATITAYQCQEDDGHVTLEPGPALYECSCGETFNRDESYDGGSHQCPVCQKFASNLADGSCPECGTAEVVEVDAVECPDCQEVFTLDVFANHLAEGC